MIPKASTSNPDVKRLLLDYVDDGKETSFRQLVFHYSSLIYSSALRRTSNADLAEEVTQKVLTILARKARVLADHPSLTGWVFQTTRLEAVKALRSEARRSAKHQAFASEPSITDDMNSDRVWERALPCLDQCLDQLPEREREVLLLYFFEKKKHREIASVRKTSVSASKMQLKRGLERLSDLLSKRGVSVPVKTLSAGLAIQFAASSPVKAASILTVNALSSAPSVSTGSLLSNTFVTMSTTKKSIMVAMFIAACSSVPALYQAEEGRELREELHSLGEKQSQSYQLADRPRPRSLSRRGRTVRDILSGSKVGFDVSKFLHELSVGRNTRSTAKIMRALLPVAAMEKEEVENLMKEIQAHDGSLTQKVIALQILSVVATSMEQHRPEVLLESLIRAKAEWGEYYDVFSPWVKKDAEAALRWFRKKERSGELFAEGSSASDRESILRHILGSLVTQNPQSAIALYHEESQQTHGLGRGLILGLLKGGHVELAKETIREEELPSRQLVLLRAAGLKMSEVGDRHPNEVLEALQEVVDHPNLNRVAHEIAVGADHLPFEERFLWLKDHADEDQLKHAVSSMIARGLKGTGKQHVIEEAAEWAATQPVGEVRDWSYGALCQSCMSHERFEEAHAHALKIVDADSQKFALKHLAGVWGRVNPDEARKALPDEFSQN